MQPGEVLHLNDFLVNGDYWMMLQQDGDLVLFYQSYQLWHSNTAGQGVRRCIMQQDGHLALYDYHGVVVWERSGGPGCYFVLQDDGNAVIYQPKVLIWATNTAGATGP
jgi:hypothetical protein